MIALPDAAAQRNIPELQLHTLIQQEQSGRRRSHSGVPAPFVNQFFTGQARSDVTYASISPGSLVSLA